MLLETIRRCLGEDANYGVRVSDEHGENACSLLNDIQRYLGDEALVALDRDGFAIPQTSYFGYGRSVWLGRTSKGQYVINVNGLHTHIYQRRLGTWHARIVEPDLEDLLVWFKRVERKWHENGIDELA